MTTASPDMMASPPRAFTPERSQTLEAVVDRILPGAHGPGAAATAVAAAVERAMLHRALRGVRRGIEQLLDRLQAQAGELYAKEFSQCDPDARDELLRALEQDPNPWTRFVFRSLVGLSLEGLLGDPVHGGNRDFRGWQAVGLRAADVRSGLCGAQER